MFSSKVFKLFLLLLVLFVCVQQSQAGFKKKYDRVKKVAKKSVETILKPIDHLTKLIIAPFKHFMALFRRSGKKNSTENETKDQKKKRFYQKLKRVIIRITKFLFRYFLDKYGKKGKSPLPEIPLPLPDIISDIIINRKSDYVEDKNILDKIGEELLEVEEDFVDFEDLGNEIKRVIEEEVKEEVTRIKRELTSGEEDEGFVESDEAADDDDDDEKENKDGDDDDENEVEEKNEEEDKEEKEKREDEKNNEDNDEKDEEDTEENDAGLNQISAEQKAKDVFSNGQVAAQTAGKQKNRSYWSAFDRWDIDVDWSTKSSAQIFAMKNEKGPHPITVLPDLFYKNQGIKKTAQIGVAQKSEKNQTIENMKKSFWLKNHKTQERQVAVEDQKSPHVLADQVAVKQKFQTTPAPTKSIWFRTFVWGTRSRRQVADEVSGQETGKQEIQDLGHPPSDLNVWDKRDKKNTPMPSLVVVKGLNKEKVLDSVLQQAEKQRDELLGRWFTSRTLGVAQKQNDAVVSVFNQEAVKENSPLHMKSVWDRRNSWNTKIPKKFAEERYSKMKPVLHVAAERVHEENNIWHKNDDWTTGLIAAAPKMDGPNDEWYTGLQ